MGLWRRHRLELVLVCFALLDAGTVLDGEGPAAPAAAALTAFSLVVLIGRRIAPLAVSLLAFAAIAVTLALSPHSTPLQFFGMLAVFGIVGAVNTGRQVLAAAAGGVAVLMYATVVLPSGGGWPDFGLSAAISLSLLLGGWLVTHRTRQVAHLAAEAAHSRERQVAHTRAALSAERARIARELHDVVSHGLSVVVVQAQAAHGALLDLSQSSGLRTEDVDRHLRAVESTARDALAEMRRMLGLLQLDTGEGRTDTPEPPSPGLDQLSSLVERARAAGVPVHAELPAGDESLPAGVSLAVHRIVQESLTNVVKHAPATPTSVTVSVGPVGVDVTVANGQPAQVADGGSPEGSGRGLLGMRERVAMYGGRLDAGPTPGGGFQVRAVIPVATDIVPEVTW